MTPTQLRPYRLPLLLALCVTLIALGGSELSSILRFDRAAIFQGQFWRIFTGHLVHLGWSHLGLNIAGLAFIWVLVGHCFNNWHWSLILAGVALGTSLGLLTFNPELAWYVGLSGVLHGMLVAGCIGDIRLGQRNSYILLVLIGAKLLWEQLAGPLPGSEASVGGTIIVDAHFYGGLCGIMWSLLFKPQRQHEHETEKREPVS